MELNDTVVAAGIGALVTLVGTQSIQYLSHKWTLSRERQLAALRLRYNIHSERYRSLLALTRERPRPRFTMDRTTGAVDFQEVFTTTNEAFQWEQDQLYPLVSADHQAKLSEAREKLRHWLHQLQNRFVGPQAISETQVPDGKPLYDAYESTLRQVIQAELDVSEQLSRSIEMGK